MNDICARAAKDGTLELLQLFSGNGEDAGCQTDLDGDGSSFAADNVYLEKGTQTLDMNYEPFPSRNYAVEDEQPDPSGDEGKHWLSKGVLVKGKEVPYESGT